ncbi:hypothetical protein K438DRAFT_1762413 [Mycena galopus ATCC 62051]|nr:hypothetical protein K438DRAFT_1762413 [Mycena galopus ATCC 62051]
MRSQVAVADPVAAVLLSQVLSSTRYIMEKAILKSMVLFIKNWEENVPVSNGWLGRIVNLNSLGTTRLATATGDRMPNQATRWLPVAAANSLMPTASERKASFAALTTGRRQDGGLDASNATATTERQDGGGLDAFDASLVVSAPNTAVFASAALLSRHKTCGKI